MFAPSPHITDFLIAGFRYWDGAEALSSLQVGTPLTLKAEPDNPYDHDAIALYFGKCKLGYVPADENEVMSKMFFYGHGDAFEARVSQKNEEAEPWAQVRAAVLIKDCRTDKPA